ncbi:ABC transporter permease [Gymnodinialimonas hymeniacidonis]|uniref:ABC transporter permease n=1 Tax=Gymnodinialimonas hymeniacidonis TaxID=3126508 RepID=UPI0034C63F8E
MDAAASHGRVQGDRQGWLSPLNRRRWRNFKRNRRAFWSLWIFAVLYGLSLLSPYLANDKPLVVNFRGEYFTPIFNFYPETAFGGDFGTEAVYRDIEVQCLIVSGGLEDCWDDPEEVIAQVEETGAFAGAEVEQGWIMWPLIPHSFNTIVDRPGHAPASPNVIGWWPEIERDGAGEPVLDEDDQPVIDWNFGLLPEDRRGTNLLGTDDTSRDVLARVIYGFELSVSFALIVTVCTSIIGIFMGALQGYFGGLVDLFWQRIIEIWNATPSLYVIIIVAAIIPMNFTLLVSLMVFFGWMNLTGVVRAEFLRARNFEYVRAARALGVGNATIMFRHILPNAMVATLTFLPFIVTGTIAGLASLDFLGFGLPSSEPSLGELTLQGKNNLQAPWLGFTAFFTFAFMLSLLVFIFEGVRDAFDPRKTFT